MKKILFLFTALFFCLALAANAQKTTIRYLTFETSYEQISLIKRIIAEFERQNPDIHVQLEATTEASRVFLTEIAAGAPPDVIYIGPDFLPQLVSKNALLPMNDLVKRDNIDMNQYYPKVVRDLTFNGNLYAFPIHYSTDAVFYNKKMFRDKGIPYPTSNWTWYDFRNIAMKLLTKDEKGEVKTFGCLIPEPTIIVSSFGGKIISDDSTRVVIKDYPQSLQAFEFIESMRGVCAPLAAQVQDTNEMKMFSQGRVAMFSGRTWQLPEIIRLTEASHLDWDIAMIPSGPVKQFSGLGVGGNCIAKGSRHPEAAWKFAKFYSSLEGQSKLGVMKNCVPALKVLADSPQSFNCPPPENIKAFRDAEAFAGVSMPYAEWRSEFQSRVWEPVMEQLRTKMIGPKQAVDQIHTTGNEFLKKFLEDSARQREAMKKYEGVNPTSFLFNFMLVLMGIGLIALIIVAGTNKRYWEGYLFIAPWLIGFVIFTLGPVMASLYLSFTKYDMVSVPIWIGFGNFQDLFKDNLFKRSLWNTLYYAVFTIPLSLTFSMILAMLLNNKLKGIYTFRAIYYLPAITSGVAISLLWRWLFHPDLGLINKALTIIGFSQSMCPKWLTDPHWAMPAIIIMSVWGGLGGSMLIYLAGLQGIPEQLYEACELDGANPWQKFWNVTLPMLSPTIFFNLIMAIIGSFQVFVTVFIMTSNQGASIEPGGPANSTLVYVLYLYRNGFRYLNMGTACAMAWVLFVIILVLTLINFYFSKKWVNYDQV